MLPSKTSDDSKSQLEESSVETIGAEKLDKLPSVTVAEVQVGEPARIALLSAFQKELFARRKCRR